MAASQQSTSYWLTPEVNAHANAVNQALFYICCGVFAYDTILSASFDASVLFGKRKFRWVHLAYFGTKLAFWGYILSAFFLFWSKTEIDCNATFQALEFFMGMTVFTSSCLLAFRTYCVFHGREQKVVLAVIATLALGLLAAWMQGVTDVKSTWKADDQTIPYLDGYCVYDSISPMYWVKYVVTIIFDLSILIMTTFGISRMASGSRLGMTLVNQGILFFVLTFLANLLISIFTLLRLSPTMSLICAMSQSTVCLICSTYLHRSLAQERQEQPTSSHFKETQSSPCRTWLRNIPVLGQLFNQTPAAEPLSFSQGTVPTFVSGTTLANAKGVDSPYPKSISVLSPRENGDIEQQRGYFDIVAADPSTAPSAIVTPAVDRRDSRQVLDFADMLREGPQRTSAVRGTSRDSTIVSPSSPEWVRINVEKSVTVEQRRE